MTEKVMEAFGELLNMYYSQNLWKAFFLRMNQDVIRSLVGVALVTLIERDAVKK